MTVGGIFFKSGLSTGRVRMLGVGLAMFGCLPVGAPSLSLVCQSVNLRLPNSAEHTSHRPLLEAITCGLACRLPSSLHVLSAQSYCPKAHIIIRWNERQGR